jgi:hypothetical protein
MSAGSRFVPIVPGVTSGWLPRDAGELGLSKRSEAIPPNNPAEAAMPTYRTFRHAIFAVLSFAWAGLGVAPAAQADPWELNGKALANFAFQGKPLPSSVEQLKQEFPAAERDHERVDDAIGLECYLVPGLPNADLARFYFCDGRLYQFEAQYNLARIEKLGGMRMLLQSLINEWGPVDHAGESRWTWQRPTYSRRADFFARPDRAQITITDTSWMPIVSKRLVREEKTKRIDTGL